MKKITLFILLSLPGFVNAQRLSKAYIGPMLHDSEIGFSLINSFGISQYFGVGAGVEITKLEGKVLGPVFMDVRGKYPIKDISPMVFGQFGFPLYSNDFNYVDETGAAKNTSINGKYFYGGGVGVSYQPGKFGFFVSYTYRDYKLKYKDEPTINGRAFLDDPSNSASIITAGLVF